jgi:hypothetical protein
MANGTKVVGLASSVLAIVLLGCGTVWGHCDTMDGPVVADAKGALEKGSVTSVLKWVGKDKEGEIRQAFQKTLVVRGKGPEAEELADMYFFETVVRIHREGEGVAYAGLKPAGTPLEAGVAASDKALDTGKVEGLVKGATDAVAAGIRQRFAEAAEAKGHADESVEAGRRFVAAYVEFVHYVERIFADAEAGAQAHGQEGKAATQPADHHGQPVKANVSPGGHEH